MATDLQPRGRHLGLVISAKGHVQRDVTTETPAWQAAGGRRPDDEVVTVALWQPAPSPSGFREVWCQNLHSLAELSALRARLRTSLTGSATVREPAREHWSERLVLIADELTSNALRHGGAPVATALSRTGDQWLLAVSDSSTDVPPVPAHGRDPGLGGFGLYLVADLSTSHGWHRERHTKTVWAVVVDDD